MPVQRAKLSLFSDTSRRAQCLQHVTRNCLPMTKCKSHFEFINANDVSLTVGSLRSRSSRSARDRRPRDSHRAGSDFYDFSNKDDHIFLNRTVLLKKSFHSQKYHCFIVVADQLVSIDSWPHIQPADTSNASSAFIGECSAFTT
jgi:hypothetical protein